MNNEKISGLIGLAVRSRQAVFGADACRIMIRSGRCGVLIIDGSAGPNTRKKAVEMCARSDVPVKTVHEGTIGGITGRTSMVMAVRQGTFAEALISELTEEP